MMADSFKCFSPFQVNGKTYHCYHLPTLGKTHDLARLPFSLKILLENLLRKEDGQNVTASDIESVLNWQPKSAPKDEIAFTPSRVILQDFTGVPAVVDLAAMRDAMKHLGSDPKRINPLSPVELVIDHSVMVDEYGSNLSFKRNTEIEVQRNKERYCFLRWGQTAFENFRVVPPGTGIVHQVNLEYLARVVFETNHNGQTIAYPDTLVGTDSHTTMINGLGVLGWGVGGIEAEAAMLGQAITMLIPQVVGFKLTGKLSEGTTATDLVLRVVEMLRQKGVVGKFVEFFGDGLDHLPLADRATISNMAPEYGATCGIFPIDQETIHYLQSSGRSQEQIDLVEAYAKHQGLYRLANSKDPEFSDVLELDLSSVTPCIAGPKRPQDRIELKSAKTNFEALKSEQKLNANPQSLTIDGQDAQIDHGAVVIAAITSCTNTSNPDVMVAAGLLAKKANERGLNRKPWVKTSLAPGSQVVTDYLDKANLTHHLEKLGFNLVGYGCTTCIGNSGPLPEPVHNAIQKGQLAASAVLSGNRNFEGRIHPLVKNAYLASPPLVVAYALAGTMDINLMEDAIGTDDQGNNVYLKDIWPTRHEIQEVVGHSIEANMFNDRYRSVFEGDESWKTLSVPTGERFAWDESSTYVKNPPYFEGMSHQPSGVNEIQAARVLVKLGDSITTDHISPAGAIAEDSPAGLYLKTCGIDKKDFNSYGSRRGNHEVMMRGTFANIRLKNQLAPGTEGSWTLYFPENKQMSIYDASMLYQQNDVPLIILAGKEYGTGSSRDWAAKGTRLLGVKAVIAESYERIHRSNLVGMGVLPLQFKPSENADSLGLTGNEHFNFDLGQLKPQGEITVYAVDDQKNERQFTVMVRIDTPKELEYYQHGGILHYVLRQLAA